MKNNNLKGTYIKTMLGYDWIPVKIKDESLKTIKVSLVGDYNFEEKDKIMFFINTKNVNQVFNTVILDVDYNSRTNEIILTISKSIEKRKYKRYNINLDCTINDTLECKIINISKKGLKLISPKPLLESSYNVLIKDLDNIFGQYKIIYGDKDKFSSNYIYGMLLKDMSLEDTKILNDFLASV